MRIFGVDPGYNFTGVAYLDVPSIYYSPDKLGEFTVLAVDQFEDPIMAYGWVKRRTVADDVVLVEDYISSGHITKEAKETIAVLGYMVNSARFDGHKTVRRVPQRRLSAVSQASDLIRLFYPRLNGSPEDACKDGLAALAHCIAYFRELHEKTG